MLGLGDDSALPAPAVQRAPDQVGEATRGTALCQALLLGRSQLVGDGVDQALVAGEAEDVVDAVVFAPGHEPIASEAGICPQQDLHAWPAGAYLGDDAGALLDRASRGVPRGVRGPHSPAGMSERRSLAASRCRPQKM